MENKNQSAAIEVFKERNAALYLHDPVVHNIINSLEVGGSPLGMLLNYLEVKDKVQDLTLFNKLTEVLAKGNHVHFSDDLKGYIIIRLEYYHKYEKKLYQRTATVLHDHKLGNEKLADCLDKMVEDIQKEIRG